MHLKQIDIKNFRGIEEISLPMDDLCVLIGENNSGKSSILDALQICLTRSLTRRINVFNEYDYHLDDATSDPATAKPINILLTFANTDANGPDEEMYQQLRDTVQVGADGAYSIILRVTSEFDRAINGFSTEYDFLDHSGQPLPRAKNPRNIINLQRLVPAFYLASLRDAAQEFRANSKFWGPFVRSLKIDDDARADLERALHKINEKVISEHTGFNSVKSQLSKTAELMPLGESEPVSIEAVPSRVFEILSRTQVNLESKTGAKIPIMRHGSGTQSLAVISLFNAFLESQLNGESEDVTYPILAMEEPEAHLHPAAIKAVGELLKNLSGQKLISTHSGDLLASVPLRHIRRLRRKNGKISLHKMEDSAFTQHDLNKIDYKVRTTRGSLLFSKCWLLVEGETEATLVPECARAMGYDLYADGVSCMEYTQIGVDKLIRLADQLGIEWFVLADNDPSGKKYEKSAKNMLNGRNASGHVRVIEHGDMEMFLCMSGFGDIYEKTISRQNKGKITAKANSLDYWKQVSTFQENNSKTRNMLAVSERMVERGRDGVPQTLQDLVERARALAKSAS